ncbi:hypothetical protein OS493_040504, partial [Desmophyllum pertusum]
MGKTDMRSSVGAFNPECTAKTSKNALRLALNLYVLWHRLDKALNQLTGPTPTALTESTMNMALTLHDTLLAFGGVAEAVKAAIKKLCHAVSTATGTGTVLGYFTPKEELKGRRLQDLDRDIIEAITGTGSGKIFDIYASGEFLESTPTV